MKKFHVFFIRFLVHLQTRSAFLAKTFLFNIMFFDNLVILVGTRMPKQKNMNTPTFQQQFLRFLALAITSISVMFLSCHWSFLTTHRHLHQNEVPESFSSQSYNVSYRCINKAIHLSQMLFFLAKLMMMIS